VRRIEQLDADIAREEQLLADNAEVLSRLEDEEKALNEANEGASENELKSREAFEKATAIVQTSEEALQEITAERAEANAARTTLERASVESTTRRDAQEQKLAAIDRELESLSQSIAGLPDPAAKRTEAETAEAVVTKCEAAANAAEEAVEAARRAEAELRPALDEARSRLNRLRAEADTLAKILNVDATDLFPPALEKITVKRGFEAALGAAFGSDLDAPLDPNAAAFWGTVEIDGGDASLPHGAKALSDVVKAPDQLARRLAQTGIVSAEDGPHLQKLLKPGQRLISREGAMWRWDGFTASADALTAAAQRLAQKNRLSELEAEIVEADKDVEIAQHAFAEAGAALGDAVAREKVARENLREAREKANHARNALAAAERAAGEKASRKAALDESRAQIVEIRDEAAAQLTAAMTALEQAPDISAVEERFEQAAQKVARDRAALAEARSAHEGLNREAQMRNSRLEAIGREREGWSSRALNAKNHGTALAERRKEATTELEKLADAPDEIEARRRALMSQLTEAEKLRQVAADSLQAAENESRERDHSATAAITALAESREARARAEERLNAAGERRSEVEARIREALNCPPHLVLKLAGLDADAPMPDAADVERKLERFKIERERLGAVNLRAEEEQRSLSERYETIVGEREDVIEAIKKMRSAIQSLNKEGRERLLAAFDVVNEHFKKLFTHLFSGGTAELQLVESEDPLDAGLEILARPPGKRPQTITLLSGGEQALTATALIFAVFLTNPAPICVLDEVDAPLDDHNVERFCDLMDEMASTTNTRFVIITHNPITMARMNRLFGVTMAEQGVSQLVSVDLQTAERLREAS
jgi:chromosome segregation protein